jgi:hypothetical protein
MIEKIYRLPLDGEADRDIIKRLDTIPNKRRAEWVRAALRYYMAIENGGHPVIVPGVSPQRPAIQQETVEEPSRRRGKRLGNLRGSDEEKNL